MSSIAPTGYKARNEVCQPAEPAYHHQAYWPADYLCIVDGQAHLYRVAGRQSVQDDHHGQDSEFLRILLPSCALILLALVAVATLVLHLHLRLVRLEKSCKGATLMTEAQRKFWSKGCTLSSSRKQTS